MAVFIRGHRPGRGATLLLAVALLLFGCVLAFLEWRLPIIDPLGHGINFTRLSPLVILVVLVPAMLPLPHRRHLWPYWLYAVSVELAAGLTGYIVLFEILPRNEPCAADFWGSWWFKVLSFVAAWLLSVGVAATCISATRLFWKPRLEPRCARCGYLLLGLRDDRCPECGNSISLRQHTRGA